MSRPTLELVVSDGTSRRPAGEPRAHAHRRADRDALAVLHVVQLAHRRLDRLDAGRSPFLPGDPVVARVPIGILERRERATEVR